MFDGRISKQKLSHKEPHICCNAVGGLDNSS